MNKKLCEVVRDILDMIEDLGDPERRSAEDNFEVTSNSMRERHESPPHAALISLTEVEAKSMLSGMVD